MGHNYGTQQTCCFALIYSPLSSTLTSITTRKAGNTAVPLAMILYSLLKAVHDWTEKYVP